MGSKVPVCIGEFGGRGLNHLASLEDAQGQFCRDIGTYPPRGQILRLGGLEVKELDDVAC